MNTNSDLITTLKTINEIVEQFLTIARKQKMNQAQAWQKAEQPMGFVWQQAWAIVANQLEA